MEKNRIHPVKVGKGVRMSFARQKEVLEMPNLIEVQTNSYQWFLSGITIHRLEIEKTKISKLDMAPLRKTKLNP